MAREEPMEAVATARVKVVALAVGVVARMAVAMAAATEEAVMVKEARVGVVSVMECEVEEMVAKDKATAEHAGRTGSRCTGGPAP